MLGEYFEVRSQYTLQNIMTLLILTDADRTVLADTHPVYLKAELHAHNKHIMKTLPWHY